MLFKDRHGMEWSWARKEILNRPEVPEWKEIFQIVSPEGEGRMGEECLGASEGPH